MVDPARPVRAAADRLRRGVAGAALLIAAVSPVLAKPKAEPPALPREHKHSSGVFTFRTPEAWKVEPAKDDPDALVASGDGLVFRFGYRDGETGLDSLHVACMVERLTPLMDVSPRVKYEHDFVGGAILEHRALDSAFVVEYDAPLQDQKVWRQRNVTLVGRGHSLCVAIHAPLAVWKKSGDTRRLAEAIMGSLAFP